MDGFTLFDWPLLQRPVGVRVCVCVVALLAMNNDIVPLLVIV